ncbi:MAG TPA: hypothetical protein VD846_02200 [Allosphingosinicella sp.]|nr:hypothetical protein [Allosphingosinicella sp.]
MSCSVAADYPELLRLLPAGRQALGTIPDGSAPHGKNAYALNSSLSARFARAARMALRVSAEALRMAGPADSPGALTGLIVTTCWGDIEDVESRYAFKRLLSPRRSLGQPM